MNIEEIQQAITATPELKTAVISSLRNDFIEGLKAEGTILRTPDEETEFIANYEKNVLPVKVQEQIGSKIKEVHEMYDNDLFNLLGEKKQPQEKTYEFLKRALDAKLKQQGKGGNDPVLADQIRELQTKLQERENYVAPEELEKVKSEYFNESLNFRLSNSLDKLPIAIPSHITDEKQQKEFVDMQKQMLKSNFLQRFTAKKDAEGHIVYYEGDQVLTDNRTAKPLTEAELIAKHYSVYLQPEKKPIAGAGSGNEGNRTADGNEASLRTKADVVKHLNEKLNPKGIMQGSAEFNKEYSRIIKDYAITE